MKPKKGKKCSRPIYFWLRQLLQGSRKFYVIFVMYVDRRENNKKLITKLLNYKIYLDYKAMEGIYTMLI